MGQSKSKSKRSGRKTRDVIVARVAQMIGGKLQERARSIPKPHVDEARLPSPSVRSTGIPKKLKIRREEGYHTHNIGRYRNGDQFMGFVVAVEPHGHASSKGGKLGWYAVLHRFDSAGKHLATETSYLGLKAWGKEVKNADATLSRMIHGFGPTQYGDIEIEPFSVEIDGHTFGLVNSSVLREGYFRFDLLPNNLAFFPPWDGSYET